MLAVSDDGGMLDFRCQSTTDRRQVADIHALTHEQQTTTQGGQNNLQEY